MVCTFHFGLAGVGLVCILSLLQRCECRIPSAASLRSQGRALAAEQSLQCVFCRMMWAAGAVAAMSSITFPAVSALVSRTADADQQGRFAPGSWNSSQRILCRQAYWALGLVLVSTKAESWQGSPDTWA